MKGSSIIILSALIASVGDNPKEIWMKLMEDVFDNRLSVEFCEFYLENPQYSIEELDYHFRNEWDI